MHMKTQVSKKYNMIASSCPQAWKETKRNGGHIGNKVKGRRRAFWDEHISHGLPPFSRLPA